MGNTHTSKKKTIFDDILDTGKQVFETTVQKLTQNPADPLIDPYLNEKHGYRSQLARISGLAAKPAGERVTSLNGYGLGKWNILHQGEDYFVLGRDGRTVLSYAPSRLDQQDNAFRDAGTDALIATGLEKAGTRYNNLLQTTKNLKQFYPNLILTGTSLGGTMAYDIGLQLDIPSYTFNMGAGPPGLDIHFNVTQPHVNYDIRNDIVSMGSVLKPYLTDLWFDAKPGIEPHSIENFF